MKYERKLWICSVLITTIIISDQMLKGWIQSNFQVGQSMEIIKDFFYFTYVQNTGAAFGFGQGSGELVRVLLFLALPVVAVLWVIYLLFKSFEGPFFITIAYALIIAGAVGNLIDRFSLRYVVDMFHFKKINFGSDFAVFNIADSAISVAAGLLIIDVLFSKKDKKISEASPS